MSPAPQRRPSASGRGAPLACQPRDPKESCPWPGFVTTSGQRSRYCGWHRLSYAPVQQQITWADAQLAAGREHPFGLPPEVTMVLTKCERCGVFTPGWRMRTKALCVPCHRRKSDGTRTERVYGVGADEYAARLAAQGGGCAICGARPRTRRLAVDHNHRTGAVRGLLCYRCNHLLLGAGHDSETLILRAADYLRGLTGQGRHDTVDITTTERTATT